MKWQAAFYAFTLLQLVSGATTAVKKPSTSDIATVGYATLNGGTTGGYKGTTTTITTLAGLKAAVAGNSKKIVMVSGTITGAAVVRVGDNTSIIGKTGSLLVGVGLRVLDATNVIIRNVKISKVLASSGDALAIQNSKRVWVDHVDLSSDKNNGKDFYDGLLDITHGSTGVTVTNSKLSNHFKAMLIGHSDTNGAQDKKITATLANNLWSGLNSRTPSFRFGTGHLFNNFFENNVDGINTRKGVQLLVENNVWTGTSKPLFAEGGFAVARGNDFGGAKNTVATGTFTKAPYTYTLLAASAVRAAVTKDAGQTLAF